LRLKGNAIGVAERYNSGILSKSRSDLKRVEKLQMKATSYFLATAALVPAVLLAFSDAGRAQDPKVNELAIKAREVLTKHCAECHGDVERPKGRLNVMNHEKLLQNEGIVVPKEPDKSDLIARISLKDDDEERMPPLDKKGLTAIEVKLLRDWISAGAPAPVAVVKTTEAPVAKVIEAAAVPAQQFSKAAKVKDLFRNRCQSCHSGTSPAGRLDIFDAASMRQRQIVKPKDVADSSKLLKRLRTTDRSEVMPPKGIPLDENEISLVREWILEGAPDFEADLERDPKYLGKDYVYEQILKDVRSLKSEASQYRYFSFNHLRAAGITKDDMKAHEQALAIAVNHLTWAPVLERPVSIDEPINTIFRVNVGRLGWLKQPFQDPTTKKDSTLTLFDLVLLEYPYAMAVPGKESYDEVVQEFQQQKITQVRPIIYLRGDWFVCMALQAPLYEDLLLLPRDVKSLERLLSVDADGNLNNVAAKNVRRAGMAVSGVSRNNRIVERHAPTKSFRHYWKSYDYATSAGESNILARPDTRKADGGEMIWSLPNGMQAYFVADSAGSRITAAPTNIVVDKHASDKIVRNGLGCIRCHGNGIQTFEDVVRPAIKELQANPPDFDRGQVLDLYATTAEMDQFVNRDKAIFQSAIKEILGEVVNVTDVLERVTKRFLDDPINGRTATAELGVPDPDNWQNMFKVGDNVLLGISNLASQGQIRRDAWEANQNRILENMRMGTPLVNLDGLSQLNFEPKDKVKVDMKLVRKSLSEAELVIKNTGRIDLFIEVVFFANNGKVVRLSTGVEELKVGGADFTFPKIEVTPDALIDHFTLYASEKKFEPGVPLRLNISGDESTADRFVHPFYELRAVNGRSELTNDAKNVQKKTIESITR